VTGSMMRSFCVKVMPRRPFRLRVIVGREVGVGGVAFRAVADRVVEVES